MPLPLNIDGLIFTFPVGWEASKYDEWSFYRNQFDKQFNGIKAVDAVALSVEHTAYLIEVKDYRHPDTEKPSALADAIALKVLHTLAALLPAKMNANDPLEKAYADRLLKAKALQVVAHIELPPRHKAVVDIADLKLKLRQKLRAVAPHLLITSCSEMRGVAWSVS